MFKFRYAYVALALAGVGSASGAAILGPDAARCSAGGERAVLVHVVGLKDRVGQVRVRTFGGSPSTWFNKKTALKRTEVPIPASGAVDICMPVEKPGTYAVDIRHDTNSNGKTDMSDGGGVSGNPEVSLLDVVFGNKPPANKVSFQVGDGVTAVTVVVKYKSGGSFKPIAQLQTTRR
jgi:uncharacterized protein (DUF2141 family)